MGTHPIFESDFDCLTDMTVSEEQEEEFEALQAIYPEIERYEESPEQPLLIFAIDLASETEENQLSVRLQISMPETYPEVGPECDVLEYSDSLDPADCVNIEKFIRETCEVQLGEIMCFTIISGVQDELNNLVDEIERRKEEEIARRKQEEEEAARKKFIGTRVTVESFLQWKVKFDEELEALKTEKQRRLEAALKGKLTGKQLFLQKKAVDEVEGEAMADQVQVDESLFDDEDLFDDDELDELDIPDE